MKRKEAVPPQMLEEDITLPYQPAGLSRGQGMLPRGVGLGPTDPLAGPVDQPHVVMNLDPLLYKIDQLISATRAVHPVMSCLIQGNGSLVANTQEQYRFMITGKRVPALALLIQNNVAGQILFIGLDQPATPGGFQIATGSNLYLPTICVHVLWLQIAATTNVGTVEKVPQSGTPGVDIQAWSNPEWTNVWGMI